MDRKYQELMALVRQGSKLTLDHTRMTGDEKRASLAIDQHVTANLI
jgi:hypothetical protein